MTRERCCTIAPPARENPPGQPALRYRTGDWDSFRAAMIAALPLQRTSAGTRPLAALTARDAADPTVAFLDAAACVFDILTFYQERHLNEGYLGTATERLSLVMIARALGYEPTPGLAASGHLAFTTSPTVTEPVLIPAGTPVMAMPEGSDPPPFFETSGPLEARPERNALSLTRRLPVPRLSRDDDRIWVDGISTRARPGDGLLLYGAHRLAEPTSERWDFRRVVAAEPDADHSQTLLRLERHLGALRTPPPDVVDRVLIFRERAQLFGHNAPAWTAQSNQTQITAWTLRGFRLGDLTEADAVANADDARTLLLRRRDPILEWPGFRLRDDPSTARDQLDLDREYPAILPDSWVVLDDGNNVEAYEVLSARPRARVDFGLTAKVTRLTLRGEHLDRFDRRATVVWCAPDALVHGGAPDTAPVTGAALTLRGDSTDLLGLPLAVFGPAPDDDTPRGEIVHVTAASVDGGTTLLTLDPPLARAYRRDSVVVNANVVRATHGQSAPPEVLGSGNAAARFARFVLKGRPLTHVSSPDEPRGRASALTVRVGGVAWSEVPFLHGQPPDARVYTLRHNEDGTTVVEFGDGESGARLPSGSENVVASYRTGLGLAGEVASARATLLTRRPDGIDAVINPAAFSGSADPEAPNSIRANAPTSVLTLDRLVALDDYENFARAFGGIGKVLASALWEGQRRLVHLTIASASGQPVQPKDPVRQDLLHALAAFQDPVHSVAVDSFVRRDFGAAAKLAIDADRAWETVEAAARTALAAAFSFATRQFGQGVTPAEVLTVLQGVAGVRAVDLDQIWRVDRHRDPAPPAVFLEAQRPRPFVQPEPERPLQPERSPTDIRGPAELLLLTSDPAEVLLVPMST